MKAAAIVVLSKELALAAGDAGTDLLNRELTTAVTAATNEAVLSVLADSSSTTTAATGDPLSDLRAGIRAAGPSQGYVVAMSAADCGDLSTRTESIGGMGVRGGTFRPGIEVVAVDDLAATVVIPASRLAITDHGLRLAPASHASVDMRDTPQSPAQQVSLWQTNCLGLLAERLFRIAGDTSGVVTVTGS